MIRKCKLCGKQFETAPSQVKLGWGKYCSRKCRNNSFIGTHHTPQTKEKNRIAHLGKKPWNKGLIGFCEGEKSGKWTGGRHKRPDGYIMLIKNKYHSADRYGRILEHRYVMEKHLGRYLLPEEVVHHKGILYPIDSIENKSDNRIENLMLFPTDGKHRKFHNSLK